MAYKVSITVILLLLFSIVNPAHADAVVGGMPIAITNVIEGPRVYFGYGWALVDVPAGCPTPIRGAAYAQRVQMDDGTQYTTVFQNDCAYPVR